MKLLHYLMEKSRKKKYKQFIEFCKPTEKDSILDVGIQNESYKASDNYLENKYPYKHKLTGLGIGILSDFSKRYPIISTVSYNGKVFPFNDRSFDYVWSNAVIEHVGDRERQELFVSEMIRVAKKKVFFTTPNRGFLFEIHTRLPFIHWLPKDKADWFYLMAGKKWASGSYMLLLYKKDVIRVLEKLQKNYSFEYISIKNKIIGMTATFSVLITKK